MVWVYCTDVDNDDFFWQSGKVEKRSKGPKDTFALTCCVYSYTVSVLRRGEDKGEVGFPSSRGCRVGMKLAVLKTEEERLDQRDVTIEQPERVSIGSG